MLRLHSSSDVENLPQTAKSTLAAGVPAEKATRTRLLAALETYGDDLPIITSGSQAGLALAALAWSVTPSFDVALLDTGLSFPDRLHALSELARRAQGQLRILRPDLSVGDQEGIYGPDLWVTAPSLCCSLRQVSVLRRALAGRPAWLAARRWSEQPVFSSPCDTPAGDHFGVPRIDPVHDWSDAQVTAFLTTHQFPGRSLPVGEPAGVACSPCTQLSRRPDGLWQTTTEPGRLLLA